MNPTPNYGFKLFWSDEDAAYIAACPDFPGISAFGDTPEQALAEVRIALELGIGTYQEEGWRLPEPKVSPSYSGQFRVRMPKALHARLVEQAEIEGVSLNTLVVSHLAHALGTDKGMERLQQRSTSVRKRQTVASSASKRAR